MDEREERHRRQEIIDAMDIIPIDMDFNDGCVILELLYTIRGQIGQGSRSLAKILHWLTYNNYKTDSDGRITGFFLDVNDFGGDDIPAFNLPPIIERLQKLKVIKLINCRGIPIELDNLPLLEEIYFAACPEELYQNIPEAQRGCNSLVSEKSRWIQMPSCHHKCLHW